MTDETTHPLTTVSRGQLSDAVFRATLDVLPVAIYITDAQGRLTYFNPATVKLTGHTPEIGSDPWAITWKLYRADGTPLPRDRCPMALALKGNEVPAGVEYIGERPDGTRFWFTLHPTVLRDADGCIIGGVNLLVDITDRKNAETEAREHFCTVVETTPECVKIVDSDGTLLFINQSGMQMLDSSCAEEVIDRNIYDVIAPEDRERFCEFNQMICGGKQGTLEFQIIGPDGGRQYMKTYAAPLRYSDGTTVHLGVTHNITERKRAERSGLLLSAIVDSSDDAIVSKNLEGVITSWNKSAERLFGYTAAEAIGQTVASLIIPEDRQCEEPDILARLRRGERVDHFETIRRRKDGSLLDISLTISPVKNAEGVIIGASKIARDITETKRIRLALVESEAHFRHLANTMPQIVWTAASAGDIDYYNERWYEFTGFNRLPSADATWESILHPNDRRRTCEAWLAAVYSGEPYSIEHRFFDRKENRWRWFMGRAVPVRNAAQEVVKWFGTFTDIDEQKHVEDQLRRANNDLEQFAFSASHDLQEPLRGIKIYSELLAKRYASKLDGEALKFMEFLRNGATRIETLVRDLLAYTQVSKSEEEPIKTVNANEVLDAVLASLSHAIAEAGAHITKGLLPSLPVNGTHLHQLFQNLIGNALKYRSPEWPPIVHISAEQQNGHWVFSVSDNGIGIDPDYKENVFGLFKRLHSNNEYSGTGIGLAICQRIVDRYDGQIWVESNPGRGSTFRFTLPI